MKRKIIIIVIILLITIGCSDVKEKIKQKINDTINNQQNFDGLSITKLDEYKDFVLSNIKSLKIIKYKEDGIDEEIILDKNIIKDYYLKISDYTILRKINSSCDDNTSIYQFIMVDNKNISFEFECQYLVLNNNRYEIKKGN